MSYNIALKYLQDKYGYVRQRPTGSFESKLSRTRSVKEKKQMVSDSTDKDYVLSLNDHLIPKDKSFDHAVLVLIGQYYYGIGAKKDLDEMMKSINLL